MTLTLATRFCSPSVAPEFPVESFHMPKEFQTRRATSQKSGKEHSGNPLPTTDTKISKKLTDRTLASLSVSTRTELTDASCPGLRFRVGQSGKKSFIYKGRDKFKQMKTVTLGQYPEVSLKEAREKAETTRRRLLNGEDPVALKRAFAVTDDSPTLRSVIEEFRLAREMKRKIWMRKTANSRCDAERAIQAVFRRDLEKPIITLTAEGLAYTMQLYKPTGRHEKKTVNGQVSRARAYLAPVLDWAAGRNSFRSIGSSRIIKLAVPDIYEVLDPAADDPLIKGKRERTLSAEELRAVLPLLHCPVPQVFNFRLDAATDVRLAAMRWLLMTLSRREEVTAMKWKDIDFRGATWTKDVKSFGNNQRTATLRLPDIHMDYLKSLPSYATRSQDDLVFRNSVGGKLQNWNRLQKATHRVSETKGWHFHDLRRTGSTLMLAIGVSPSVVDDILGHKQPNHGPKVSAALENYRGRLDINLGGDDVQRKALKALADCLESIEKSAG